jgi:hypothetical protein
LSDKIKFVNKLRRKFKKCKNDSIRAQRKNKYYCEKIKYQKLIKKSKIESWKRYYFESQTWGLPYKISFNKLKKDASMPNFKIVDIEFTSTPKESLDFALNKIFTNDDISNQNEFQIQLRNRIQFLPQTEDDNIFSSKEITEVINNLKKRKTPGIDSISNELIRILNQINPSLYVTLFNKCLTYCHFPKLWKIAKVKLIVKNDSKPLNDKSNYRPIALLPNMGKVLEKLITDRLNYYFRKYYLLSGNQYGFTPHKSTEDAINYVIELAKKQLKLKAFLLIISLDIKGGFDNASWAYILHQPTIKNIPKNLYNLLKSYFSDRKMILIISDVLSRKFVNKGCGQGSICAPILWLVLSDEFLRLELPEYSETCAYCDDTLPLIYHRNISVIEETANILLQMIYDWGQKVKLTFNPEKSKAVLITDKRKFIKPVLKMNGREIKIEKSIKHSGVITDSKLNFN